MSDPEPEYVSLGTASTVAVQSIVLLLGETMANAHQAMEYSNIDAMSAAHLFHVVVTEQVIDGLPTEYQEMLLIGAHTTFKKYIAERLDDIGSGEAKKYL